MNRIIVLGMIIASFFLTSCEKDEIGGTAAEAIAGEWYVTADAINSDGSIWEEDVYGFGYFLIATYNTASNSATEIWVDDAKHFWQFKVKAKVDMSALTFSADNAANAYYNSQVTITNGKVSYGTAVTPSGAKADAITFDVFFDDDEDAADYGFAGYRISGYRYTGLAADD